jgi:hypothetical protein
MNSKENTLNHQLMERSGNNSEDKNKKHNSSISDDSYSNFCFWMCVYNDNSSCCSDCIN